MANNSQKRKQLVHVKAEIDPNENLSAEYVPKLNNWPYTYDEERKLVICPRGSTYLIMKEGKTKENEDEERMKSVNTGISQVKYNFIIKIKISRK